MHDKKLENKAWFKAREDIELICKPLFAQTPIRAVQYNRIYKDGSRTILSNNNDLVIHGYVKPDAKIKQLYTTGLRGTERYVFTQSWAEHIQDSTISTLVKSQLREEHDLFNFKSEFDIVENHSNYEEVLAFWMPGELMGMDNFYVNNLNTLELFRLYFLDKARSLIETVDMDRVVKPWRILNPETIYINQLNSNSVILRKLQEPKLADKLKIMPKKFYFKSNGTDDYLTKREIELTLQLIRGKSNTEAAKNLFISPRTVETHLKSLRLKTGIQDRQSLVDFFGNLGLSRIH